MSRSRLLLFRLNGVPDAEAEAVREALIQEGIIFYETHAGAFGFGTAAIWLDTADQSVILRAKATIVTVKQSVLQKARTSYDPSDTLWRRLLQQPLLFLACVLGTIAVLYLTLIPFVGFLS